MMHSNTDRPLSTTAFIYDVGDVIKKDGIKYYIVCQFLTLNDRKRIVVEPACMPGFYMIKSESFALGHRRFSLSSIIPSLRRKKIHAFTEENSDDLYTFSVGDRAYKNKGNYQAEGTIVGRFASEYDDNNSNMQYVFLFDNPRGLLHIFSEHQLTTIQEGV